MLTLSSPAQAAFCKTACGVEQMLRTHKAEKSTPSAVPLGDLLTIDPANEALSLQHCGGI